MSDGQIYDYKQLPSNTKIGDPTKTGRYCEVCQGYLPFSSLIWWYVILIVIIEILKILKLYIPLCHILEFWLSPTPMFSGHLWHHLQSCIATSLIPGKWYSLISLKWTFYIYHCILHFLYSVSSNSEYNILLFSVVTLIFLSDFICYLFSDLSSHLFCYLV